MVDDLAGGIIIDLDFLRDPSIEAYVKLRRGSPDKEFRNTVTWGLDWLLANEGLLRDHRIEPDLVAGSLDSDPEDISELSLVLLERLIERREAEDVGKTHLASRGEAISDSLVNYLIAMMLDALSDNNQLYIPRDLIVLIRHQIGVGSESAITKRHRSHELEQNIITIGAQLLEYGETLSTRKLAKILKVNASTISRMFPGTQLQEKSQRFLDGMRMFGKSDTPFSDIMKKRMDENDPE